MAVRECEWSGLNNNMTANADISSRTDHKQLEIIDMTSSDDDDQPYLPETFFIDQAYTLQTLTVSAVLAGQQQLAESVKYYALKDATTAFDLTGQIVWPATEILGAYILSTCTKSATSEQLHSPLFSQRAVVELGSGCGVISMLLSKLQLCSKCSATDHNPHVLQLIQQNIEYMSVHHPQSTPMAAQLLEWGDEHAQLIAGIKADTEVPYTFIGSDICYSIDAVHQLMKTIATLLSTQRQPAQFVMSYVKRWNTVDAAVYSEAQQNGLRIVDTPLHTFMDVHERLCDGHLFVLTLANTVQRVSPHTDSAAILSETVLDIRDANRLCVSAERHIKRLQELIDVDHDVLHVIRSDTFQQQLYDTIANDVVIKQFPPHPVWSSNLWRLLIDLIESYNATLTFQLQQERQHSQQFQDDVKSCVGMTYYRTMTYYDKAVNDAEVQEITISLHTIARAMQIIGCALWPAAVLSNYYILQNKAEFADKRVLDLGSGTAASAILLHRCKPAYICATDYEDSVLEAMQLNFDNNFKQLCPHGAASCHCQYSVEKLDWTALDDQQLKRIAPDIVLAADCCYIDSDLDMFSNCLQQCLRASRDPATAYCLLVQKERNPLVYLQMCTSLRTFGMQLQELDVTDIQQLCDGQLDHTEFHDVFVQRVSLSSP